MEDLLSLAIKVEEQQQLLAAWLSSNSISKVADLNKHHKRKKSSGATFHSSSSPMMEEFVEYAVIGDMYVDDEPLIQPSSKGLGCFVLCIEDVNVDGEKESQPIVYFREHLNRTCLKYSTYGKALDVLHLIDQGILNKRHAQSAELLESFPLVEQDSRTNLFEEGENDTCSGGHFRHVRDKGQNENLLMFKDQNTRIITLCRFWTSRRPMVRLKRKCIDLKCKEHGFHKVTWNASNHMKSAKLIGFSLDSEIT
ncbi:hypothetical protein PIB30_000828 [Stylosanthes scabra]|uniref:Uncharacterized protein n=1 Tax=Stylosanthes scabra TaxID=79078 RepID=A0ABU6Q2C8_9FABA|nr:hypothetical protein [Stylosanthes scabra]